MAIPVLSCPAAFFGGSGESIPEEGLKSEVWRLETGDWRLETGDWRLETGDWRLETGDWRGAISPQVPHDP
jgi:hypothetical protein